jgi:16S rRNA (uracil1498-N3)-methyltransferase
VRAEVLSHRLVDRESPLALQLAVALPRGDRQTWLVEKAVELGVQSLLPLITDRGVAVPNERTILRLRRTVVESSKQCGRNRLMQIDPPCRLPDYLMLEADSRTQRLLAHPVPHADDAAAAMPDGSSRAEFDRFRVAIGPEGGFTHDEVKLARDHGWRTISCGPRILRVETAAIAISARILL